MGYASKYALRGRTIPFTHWVDEWQENVIKDDFTMPSHSMAFYAQYDMPQLFSWTYDVDTQKYTSKKAGVRPAKNVVGGYYGTLSVTLDINNESTNGIGIIWNLSYGESDYIYTEDCEYWYFHMNPSNGGFQFAKVQNGEYSALTTVQLANSPSTWQLKWSEWKNLGGVLTTDFSVEFNPKKTVLYVDGAELYSYEGEKLGTVLGTEVGVRTNSLGNCARNVVFNANEFSNVTSTATYIDGATNEQLDKRLYTTDENIYLPTVSKSGYEFVGWFLESDYTTKVTSASGLTSDLNLYAKFDKISTSNGYNIYLDGKYKAVAKNATVTVGDLGDKYGKWSVDITVNDVTNARVGLLINAFVPTSQDAVLFSNGEICGYYIHHNVKANANFTLTTINNGVYGGKPSGTTGSLSVKSYTQDSEGKLGEYYAKNKAFLDGEIDELTFNLAIEVLNTYIKVYLDGDCIIEYEDESGLELFASNASCVGVGFNAYSIGTEFSNMSFEPYTENA